ncbi:MAG: phosphoglucosamine mutase [Actinomycetota bacterium]|nr:phosphoglucosamine mutase [Actinomycetota bacterium]
MRARFGTDGIRGVANTELTPELLLALGRACARALGPGSVLVGRDTRRSGPLLQAALSAGLAAEGTDVCDLGVLPTPGIAFAAASRSVPAFVVSASHNPYRDNGVKVFDATGRKIPRKTEAVIEEALDAVLGTDEADLGDPTVGALTTYAGAHDDYVDHLCASVEGGSLDGLTVVVDAANGAATEVAPLVFARLGARVQTIGATPNGENINDGCGSTHPEALIASVRDSGADLGLALDGDADRLVACDADGNLVDGDVLLALFAADLQAQGRLEGKTIVATVLSNLGLTRAMDAIGVTVVSCPVGDRNVLQAMDAGGFVLGGEQSGHIVFRDQATTGDGILTAVMLCDLVCRAKQPLADLAAGAMTRLPQVSATVTVADVARLDDAMPLWAEVAVVEAELADRGRVVVRASGTEAAVRVMVEAPTDEEARAAAARLSAAVAHALGSS